MKSRKELLLQELEDISAQLVDIQYRLDASKRKPVPTIPVIYPEERHQDPFHVSKSGTVPDLEFKTKICVKSKVIRYFCYSSAESVEK